MPQALTTDILLRSVGKRVKSSEDKLLGKIIEITRNTSDSSIEYLILKSNQEDRHFAIPASSKLIKISGAGEIILQFSKEDLQVVNALNRKKCPIPDFHNTPSVFELICYNGPLIERQESM